MRVPGRARPRLASSAAMPAARSCWPVVGDTLSMMACGVRDPGAFFQYELLCEYGGGRLYRRLAAGVSAAAGGRVRPPGRHRRGAGRARAGQEPAVGGGGARARPAGTGGSRARAGPPPRAGGGVGAAPVGGLGAGAGLSRSDLRGAGGPAVPRRPGGVVVQVRGRTPRVVPVLARYHGRLLAAAAFAGEHLLTGGTDPARGNITNPVVASLAGGTRLPPPDTSPPPPPRLAATPAPL